MNKNLYSKNIYMVKKAFSLQKSSKNTMTKTPKIIRKTKINKKLF